MNQNDYSNRTAVVAPRTGVSPALSSEPVLLLKRESTSNGCRDYLSIFFRYKIGILVSFLAISAIGIACVFPYQYLLYKPKFQARSLLLVKVGWENYTPDLSLENRRTSSVNLGEIVNSEVRILQSRELKERIVDYLKPERIFPDLATDPPTGISKSQAAVLMLESEKVKVFSVTPMRGNVIEVAFTGRDPATSAAFVNQLISFYIERRTEIYKDPKTVLFLEKKAEEYRQKLAESESMLIKFRDETKIISFDEQRTALLAQHSNLISSINGTANQIKEVQEKISELDRQLNSLPKTTVTVAAAERQGDAETRLLNLQLQEAELLSKYTEDNRLVVNIRNQMKMIKEHLASQNGRSRPGTAPADPVYQEIQRQILQNKAELSSLKARSVALDQQFADLNSSIQTFEARENKNKALLREIAGNEEKYRTYRQRLEESRIYDELERQKMSSVAVIEPATVPLVPVNPMKPLALLIVAALVAGCFGSLGIAFLRMMLNQGISTPSEIEKRLDIPVLITIPVK